MIKNNTGGWWLIVPSKDGLTGAAYHVKGESKDIDLAVLEVYYTTGKVPIVTGERFDLQINQLDEVK